MNACKPSARLNRFLAAGLALLSGAAFASALDAQEPDPDSGGFEARGTGLVFDESAYRGTPYKAAFTADTYSNLPARASVERYAPTPGDQGKYGTCVAFAVGYHMRTIIHGIENGITSRSALDRTIFSPTFVYERVKSADDHDCQQGTSPMLALELLRNEGVPLLSTVPYRCGAPIGANAMMEALQYPILDYQRLFSGTETDPAVRINTTKKALAEGWPVVLGFKVVKSFYVAGKVWRRLPSDGGAEGKHGAHAMLVVGYDDNVAGGAFRVMNSWGSKWGDGGFVWIPYDDYAREALLAIQAYGLNPPPPPPPRAGEATTGAKLRAGVRFEERDGSPMPAALALAAAPSSAAAPVEDLVAYRMLRSYPSGTRFRFYITLNTQSYLYAFATDLTGKINPILPFADGMSALVGPNSTVAFPSERKVVRMDQTPGTDYLLLLFSDRPLDAADLKAKLDASTGTLSARVRAALGPRLASKGAVAYSPDSINFQLGGAAAAPGTVVPLMVELVHH
jgi:hypothetical protein